MVTHCSKCLTKSNEDSLPTFVSYAFPQGNLQGMETHALCSFCHGCFERAGDIRLFLLDDYGGMPIPKIETDMIEARKKRSLGKGPWANKD